MVTAGPEKTDQRMADGRDKITTKTGTTTDEHDARSTHFTKEQSKDASSRRSQSSSSADGSGSKRNDVKK